MTTKALLLLLFLAAQEAAASDPATMDELLEQEGVHQKELARPDVFSDRGRRLDCHENGVVAAWCDSFLHADLECSILPDFDEYGCACHGNAALCPTECIGEDSVIEERTHYDIRCGKLPADEPNYVLIERHAPHRCENNALVASWCDDAMNPHLTCHLGENEYSCHCGGKAAACPTDCVGGVEPIERTHSTVRCQGIPLDQPNYILKEA